MVTDGDKIYCGDHNVRCINAKSLSRSTETKIILYSNYTLIKNFKKQTTRKITQDVHAGPLSDNDKN